MPITDLTGCTWVGYEPIPTDDTVHQFLVDFNCDGEAYQGFYITFSTLYYTTSGTNFTDVKVCSRGEWLDDAYKTISFTGGEDITNAEFIAWLQENGTITQTEEETTPITITYNGKSTVLTDGKTAKLTCAGKKAVTDIVVAFDSYGCITYNGTETAVESGKTATLACAGKKMLTDVIVTVVEVTPDSRAGLYDANDNLVASWDTLVNTYGLDVEKDYTLSGDTDFRTAPSSLYCVLKHSELSTGTKLIIADGLTRIGNSALRECANITNIDIPDSVTSIGECQFYLCTKLTGVIFGKGITVIPLCAFAYCYGITSIIIPTNVTSIDVQAFVQCKNLADVYYEGTAEQWQAITIEEGNDYLTSATIHYNYTG